MSIGAHELRPDRGATHKKKRIGRGNASGQGTYAGKGLKGQKSRSGKNSPYDAFEGGQFPMSRKFHVLRGFNNKWRVEYQPVNLAALERFVKYLVNTEHKAETTARVYKSLCAKALAQGPDGNNKLMMSALEALRRFRASQ